MARTWPDVRRWVEIVYTLAQRDFQSRFRGNWLGAIGVVVVPVLFLVSYTFVFSTLMPVKIRPDANREDYAFFFFAGLIGWTLFADATARAPRLFAGNVSFVRKALFPLSALPAASTLVALFHALIWFGVFLVVRFFREGGLPVSALAAPLMLLLLAGITTGVSLVLAAIGALARDLADLVGPLLTVLLFASPVIYPAERLASVAPWLLTWNPLASPIEGLRASLFDGAWPSATSIGVSAAWACAALAIGTLAHRRVRPLLGDLL
jgi:lipopolysaccharide transport system permease protein